MGKSKLKQQLKRKLPTSATGAKASSLTTPSTAGLSKKQLKKQRRLAAAAARSSTDGKTNTEADNDDDDAVDGELREIDELDFDDALAAGIAFEQMASLDGALAAFKAAVAARPDSLDALSRLADVYAANEQPALALQTYTQATTLPDADASVWFRRGVTLMALEQPRDAIASLMTAKQQSLDAIATAASDGDDDDDNAMKAYSVTLAALATCYGELGDLDSAVREYKQATLQFPTIGDLHYNLATMYQAGGDFESATASLEAAIVCDATVGAFYDELIECLQQRLQTNDNGAAAMMQHVTALQATRDALVAAEAEAQAEAEEAKVDGEEDEGIEEESESDEEEEEEEEEDDE